MNNNYHIKNNKITFETGKIIEFDFPVLSTTTYRNDLIVVLDVLGNAIYNQNVFSINNEGNINWQIEKSENLNLIGYCPFISSEIENEVLVVYNWCGFRYTVDLKFGKVIDRVFTK